MTRRITIGTDHPYEVVIGRDVHHELRALIGDGVLRVAIIHPPTMAERAAALQVQLLDDGLVVHLIEVPDSEAAKSADVLTDCWRQLGEAGFTRSDAVVGLGGGATTDLAGFVAASWLRGVRFVNVPTTVLGMVDAAVGGKTGINTAQGKNLVGAFHEPAGVLCDLDVLGGLPTAELRSGLAEVLKCGFIADPVILELFEQDTQAALDPTSAVRAELITRGIEVKAAAVGGDFREQGAGGGIGREALNYGHTLGHAIEKLENLTMWHGADSAPIRHGADSAPIRHGADSAPVKHGADSAPIRHGADSAPVKHGADSAPIRHGADSAPVKHGADSAPVKHGADSAPIRHGADSAPIRHGADSAPVKHGEAISIGMVFVAELAHRTGRIDAALLDRHRQVLGDAGLPVTYRSDVWPDLLAAMRLDKKSRGDQLRFVVLDALAAPVILAGPDEQVLLDSYRAVSA